MRAGVGRRALSCASLIALAVLGGACLDTSGLSGETGGAQGVDDGDAGGSGGDPGAATGGSGGATSSGVDADHDGHATPDDCDDHDPLVFPGATETCNDKDDNCNGKIDEGFDADGDGYYVCPHGAQVADCNDKSAAINDPSKPAKPVTNDAFATVNSHWSAVGTTQLGGTIAGYAQLTAAAPSSVGALWWNAAYLFDHFEMTAKISIRVAANAVPADGVTFAWVPGATATAAGPAGAGWAFVGLGGYAVAIDTYQNVGEAAVPNVSLVNGMTGARIATAALPATVTDGADHALAVTLQAGKATVLVDGKAYLSAVAIPGYVPFVGHWGFTASTGTHDEANLVTAVSMTFPDGQGCVP